MPMRVIKSELADGPSYQIIEGSYTEAEMAELLAAADASQWIEAQAVVVSPEEYQEQP
jgi:hypothetical protein